MREVEIMGSVLLQRLNNLNHGLTILPLDDKSFLRYGRVYKNLKVDGYLDYLDKHARPSEDVYYEGDIVGTQFNREEFLPIINSVFGGMGDVQVGMCHGKNKKLNALEYHKGSEVLITGTDMVILMGHADDIDWPQGTFDTSKVQAYLVPRGTIYEIAAKVLHFAPAHINEDEGFKLVVFLPRGTNDALDFTPTSEGEEILLLGKNKWFLAHAEDTGSVAMGAHIGLTGKNITVNT
jgi:hypothetical protein